MASGLGIIPELITAAAAVAPTVYAIVDDQQKKKQEKKDKQEQARVAALNSAGLPAVHVPSESTWPTWALPVGVTLGVIIFGSLVIVAMSGKKSKGK